MRYFTWKLEFVSNILWKIVDLPLHFIIITFIINIIFIIFIITGIFEQEQFTVLKK